MKVYRFIILSSLVFIAGLMIWQKMSFQQWIKTGHLRIESLKTKNIDPFISTKPKLLQAYLKKVLPHNSPITCRTLKFKQKGLFRMNPNDLMTDFKAHQVVSLIHPMFSWEALITSKGIPFTVCDRLIDNSGELEARLFGIFRVAKAQGEEILRGELLRYLAEIPWFPQAIVNQPSIEWQQKGDSQLRATIKVNDVSATVEYRLQDNLIQSIFVPDRERTVGKQSIPTPWLGEFKNYKQIGNVWIPTYGEVSWILPEEKFTYFKGNIMDYEVSCE